MYGWTGNIAYTDLTGRKIRYDPPPADLLHEYLNSRGLSGSGPATRPVRQWLFRRHGAD